MSTILNQKNKETFDKENPPHPTLGLKKLNSVDETTTKKTVLGNTAQTCVIDI